MRCGKPRAATCSAVPAPCAPGHVRRAPLSLNSENPSCVQAYKESTPSLPCQPFRKHEKKQDGLAGSMNAPWSKRSFFNVTTRGGLRYKIDFLSFISFIVTRLKLQKYFSWFLAIICFFCFDLFSGVYFSHRCACMQAASRHGKDLGQSRLLSTLR